MRITIAALFLLTAPVFAQTKPSAKLVFPAKMGAVTYDHAAHAKRAGTAGCAACHPKLFEQSAKAPLNFKAAMHKTAEANKTSCGFCHRPGGAAFATAGNCAKCHVKPAAK